MLAIVYVHLRPRWTKRQSPAGSSPLPVVKVIFPGFRSWGFRDPYIMSDGRQLVVAMQKHIPSAKQMGFLARDNDPVTSEPSREQRS
jgi:hypothetical protein